MRTTRFWQGTSPAEIVAGKIGVLSARRILTPMFLTGLDPIRHTFIFEHAYIPILVGILAITLLGLGSLARKMGGSLNIAIITYTLFLVVHSIYGFRIISGHEGRMPGQITDFTAPLFFLALVWAWYERKSWAWFVAFALGTFNRETTLALIPLAAFWSPIGGVVSLGLWLAIKAFLSWWMPGPVGMFQSAANLAHLETFLSDPIAGLRFAAELLIGGVVPILGVRTALKSGKLRPLLLTFLLYYAAMFAFGCINELRIYNELSIITALLFSLPYGQPKIVTQ